MNKNTMFLIALVLAGLYPICIAYQLDIKEVYKFTILFMIGSYAGYLVGEKLGNS